MERVVDCAVLRVTTSQNTPTCVPFLRVEWRGGEPAANPASAAVASVAAVVHWMPLWCFHPFAVEAVITSVPPISGNHSAVMVWLIDTVARVCAHCRGGRRCADHALPPLTGGVTALATYASDPAQFRHLHYLSVPSGVTYLRPVPSAAGWDQHAPSGHLMLAFRAPISRARSDAIAPVLTASVSHSSDSVFGNIAAQTYLRGVFDSLGVRDLTEEEARDAFLAEPDEISLMISKLPPYCFPKWIKGAKLAPSSRSRQRKRAKLPHADAASSAASDDEDEDEGEDNREVVADFENDGGDDDGSCGGSVVEVVELAGRKRLAAPASSQAAAASAAHAGGGDLSRHSSGHGNSSSISSARGRDGFLRGDDGGQGGDDESRIAAAQLREAAAEQRLEGLRARLSASDEEHRARSTALEARLDASLERARSAEAALALAQLHLLQQQQARAQQQAHQAHQQYVFQQQQQQQQQQQHPLASYYQHPQQALYPTSLYYNVPPAISTAVGVAPMYPPHFPATHLSTVPTASVVFADAAAAGGPSSVTASHLLAATTGHASAAAAAATFGANVYVQPAPPPFPTTGAGDASQRGQQQYYM